MSGRLKPHQTNSLEMMLIEEKYIRPGATTIPGAPGAAQGGSPCQIRPPANMIHPLEQKELLVCKKVSMQVLDYLVFFPSKHGLNMQGIFKMGMKFQGIACPGKTRMAFPPMMNSKIPTEDVLNWSAGQGKDFSINKSSSSLKFKNIDKDNNGGSSEAGKPADKYAKTVDLDSQQRLRPEARDSVDMESSDGDSKEQSERFKVPMPSDKETMFIKKLESEPFPSAKTENPGSSIPTT